MAGRKTNRTPLKVRTQSPRPLLNPNDDDLERSQRRAARAATSVRRMSLLGAESMPSESSIAFQDLLEKGQIMDLLNNCIKLASENKINQRNTWELSLIDHLSEIIHVDDDIDAETNFQKASCTLEAGVKIYSLRVDSVHSEAYKVLGGINRTGKGENNEGNKEEEEKEDGAADEEENDANESQIKMSNPSNTLESSIDALNVKKFDVAFSVDPLYHQTSAQFDEGGAKGLLFNTLSVNNDCLLVFDSSDAPEKNTKSGITEDAETLEMLDLSFINDCIKQMAIGIKSSSEISPTLKEILKFLDDPYRDTAQLIQNDSDISYNNEEIFNDFSMGEEIDCPGYVNDMSADNLNTTFMGSLFDHDDGTEAYPEDNGSCMEQDNECDEDMPDEPTIDYLFLGMGLPVKTKLWAGPDHWKFKRPKDISKNAETENDESTNENKLKRRKKEPFSIDFLNPAGNLIGFAPPKSQKSLMMTQVSSNAQTILPEDCHYHAEELVKLFILPSIMCIPREAKKTTDDGFEHSGYQEASYSWDNEGFDASWDDLHSSVEEDYTNSNEEMVVEPRKVKKIEVNYDKTSKQVDVHILKKTLWNIMDEDWRNMSKEEEEGSKSELSFQRLLKDIPDDCPAAEPEDISVHLCFICLLHLANEHCLSIKGVGSLDDLIIRSSNTVSD